MSTKLLSREIYKTLKSKIIDFELLPRQILLVQQLAIEYNISRTPVREALVRLKEDGFVEETEGRKFRVSEITWAQITDLYNVRKLLESQALKEIGNRLTKKQISHLKTIISNMESNYKKAEFSSFFDNDLKFHDYILSLYNNQVIMDWMRRIQDHQQRIRYLTLNIQSRLPESIKEHQRIVEHLESGDSTKAVEVLNNHLDAAVADMLKLRSGYVPATIR